MASMHRKCRKSKNPTPIIPLRGNGHWDSTAAWWQNQKWGKPRNKHDQKSGPIQG